MSCSWSSRWDWSSSSSTARLPVPGHRLVGADHEPLDSGLVLERLQRDDHLHGRAVGVRDDPAVRGERLWVDLADDERHVLLHAPARGVVDHRRARGDEPRSPLARGGAPGREQRDVEVLDRLVVEGADDQAALELPSGRARGGERARSRSAGKPRSRNSASISVPTCPVAPTTATRYPSPMASGYRSFASVRPSGRGGAEARPAAPADRRPRHDPTRAAVRLAGHRRRPVRLPSSPGRRRG